MKRTSFAISLFLIGAFFLFNSTALPFLWALAGNPFAYPLLPQPRSGDAQPARRQRRGGGRNDLLANRLGLRAHRPARHAAQHAISSM